MFTPTGPADGGSVICYILNRPRSLHVAEHELRSTHDQYLQNSQKSCVKTFLFVGLSVCFAPEKCVPENYGLPSVKIYLPLNKIFYMYAAKTIS